MITLRTSQARTLKLLAGSIRAGNKRIMIQLPTGAGKTILAGRIIKGHLDKGGNPWFVVTRTTLINQTHASLKNHWCVDCGVIQAQNPLTNPDLDCQIASIQTVGRRQGYRLPTMIIIDEAHEVHDAHLRLLDQCPDAIVIGLSATPWSAGLGKIYQDLIVGATPSELISEGVLVPSEVYAPFIPDTKGIDKRGGDFVASQVSKYMRQKHIIGNVVDHWLKHCDGKRTLLFAADVEQSKEYAARFVEAGVAAVHVDAYTKQDDRTVLLKAIRDGNIEVLTSVGVLTTGVDVPNLEAGIFAAITQSEIKHHQCWGRILRSHQGKGAAMIMDHAGNTIRMREAGKFALPEDVGYRPLDSGCRKKDKPLKDEEVTKMMHPCPSCGHIANKPWRLCSRCGFEKTVTSDRQETDHILVKAGVSKEKQITFEQKKEFYARLVGYAEEKGYRNPRGYALGLAMQKYKDLTLDVFNEPSLPPDQTARKWAKHCQIKKAKARQRRYK